MISLLQNYKSALLWFFTGLLAVVLVSWASAPSNQVYQASVPTEYSASDYSVSHLEPNFYQ